MHGQISKSTQQELIYETSGLEPPKANRSTRGSAMAPPNTFCKAIIQAFAWRNHKQAPPSFWSRYEERNGIPKFGKKVKSDQIVNNKKKVTKQVNIKKNEGKIEM